MKPVLTAHDAFLVCERIAESRAYPSARSEYGDGYRAAAEHILAAIRAKRDGREDAPLERDLRDAEVEARTFARVVDAAVVAVERVGEHTEAAEAVRSVVQTFFADGDLPPLLRHRERSSSVRLVDRPVAAGAPTLSAALRRQ